MSAPAKSPRRPHLAGALLRTQPDERLAQLTGEGSDAAFDELDRRHRSNLVAFAGTIAPSGYAEDAVQDSLLKARAALLRGDRPEHAKAWLYRIVRNTALNERRGYRGHEQIDENYDGVEQPPQAFERSQEMKALVLALNDLPKAQRRALVQRELEGRGHDEIADALEVSPGAVRQLIHRARNTLRAGAGALVPVSLLRLATLGAGGEQVAGGAAATGLGLTGAKLGVGAVLATGAFVAGVDVGKHSAEQGVPREPTVAIESRATPSAFSAAASTATVERPAQVKASIEKVAELTARQRVGAHERDVARHGERDHHRYGEEQPPPGRQQHDGDGASEPASEGSGEQTGHTAPATTTTPKGGGGGQGGAQQKQGAKPAP